MSVLPQSIMQEQFGEISARLLRGGRLALDPAWEAANLETAEVAILGRVRSHRLLLLALRQALAELDARRLVPTIEREASGCRNLRAIAGTDQPSRHAWGIAVDIVPHPDDPQIVEVMERWAFTWGGRWIEPDPVHFEYVRPAKL